MKIKAEPALIGAAIVVSFAAYLWMSVTTHVEPVEWHDGDLIVHHEKNLPVLPAFAVKDAIPAHIGIVKVSDEGVTVIEALETVTETPIQTFISRAAGKEFDVYRLPEMTQIQSRMVLTAAKAQIGKPGDFFLDQSPDQIYSAELIRTAYAAAGFELGQLVRLGQLAKANPLVAAKFMGRWSENKTCKRRYLDYEQCWNVIARYDVITPDALTSDPKVARIYASDPSKAVTVAQSKPPETRTPQVAASEVPDAAPALRLRP